MSILKNITAVLAFIFIAGGVSAQDTKTAVIDVKVSTQCEMCKERIEKALAFEKGVTNSVVDLEKDIVKVTYKKGKTTPEAIKKAISLVGYDADDVAADAKAYAKLPGCCKKPEDGGPGKH